MARRSQACYNVRLASPSRCFAERKSQEPKRAQLLFAIEKFSIVCSSAFSYYFLPTLCICATVTAVCVALICRILLASTRVPPTVLYGTAVHSVDGTVHE